VSRIKASVLIMVVHVEPSVSADRPRRCLVLLQQISIQSLEPRAKELDKLFVMAWLQCLGNDRGDSRSIYDLVVNGTMRFTAEWSLLRSMARGLVDRGQLAEIAVDRFAVAALGFHLNREMLDAELRGDSEANDPQEFTG
jgi:hypothetical protein